MIAKFPFFHIKSTETHLKYVLSIMFLSGMRLYDVIMLNCKAIRRWYNHVLNDNIRRWHSTSARRPGQISKLGAGMDD